MEIKRPILKKDHLVEEKNIDSGSLRLDIESALLNDLSFDNREMSDIELYEVCLLYTSPSPRDS